MYKLPIVGIVMKRNYAFFKENTAITNLIHIVFGFGLALIFTSENLLKIGLLLVVVSLLAHVYAFVKGGKTAVKN